MRLVVMLCLLSMFTAPAFAQSVPPPVRAVSLEGPRVGLTVLPGGMLDGFAGPLRDVGPVITQFGWQFEKQFQIGEGMSTVLEFVPLLGGLEQGVALPSLTWMVGFRNRAGVEFGIGPNLSAAGPALAIAGGVTFRAGALNVPVNLAVVPSRHGARVSVLTGFTLRRRRSRFRAWNPGTRNRQPGTRNRQPGTVHEELGRFRELRRRASSPCWIPCAPESAD